MSAARLSANIRPLEAIPPALFAEWTELAASASEPNSFAEAWFVSASLDTFGRDCAIWLGEVRRGPELIGVMPLAIEQGYARMQIRFVQNWCHNHLFLGTPLIRAGEEKAFWSALLAALDDEAWAPNFLHLRWLLDDGPVHRGLAAAARGQGRACATVLRRSRALLEAGVEAGDYYRSAVRAKKRKEIRRLQRRLAELGPMQVRSLADAAQVGSWCDAYLAMEKAGWKGRAGTALACNPPAEGFFRNAAAAAWDAGKLDFLRLDLDERPIAMLVSFLARPGGFSFKTCFDEAFARFSPGVLIQIENLATLGRHGLDWMDSCAIDHHPMIDSFWTGRRSVVRVTVQLKGVRRSLVHVGCRTLEKGSALARRIAGGGK